MPVRIVKDNPDEMVVNDNFSFEDPQGNSQQSGGSGGGIDLSFLNDLLGGGGGGQKGGGGSILDLLGGGGGQRGGGSILDLLGGGGGQVNQGGGGAGLLGGLINSFLGGGGGQTNRGGGGGNNSLLSALGGMAVNACINYAINSFMNKGGGGSFSKGAPPSKEDVDGLLNERLNSAELCVSLWSHTVFADQELQPQEEQVLKQLINDTVSQLFPSSIANQNEVRQILTDRINSPLDYDEIVDAASQDYNFAGQLFQQACLLIAADRALGGQEDNYLDNLGADLGLQDNDANTIRQKFGV